MSNADKAKFPFHPFDMLDNALTIIPKAKSMPATVEDAFTKSSLFINASMTIDAAIIRMDFPTSFTRFLFLLKFFMESDTDDMKSLNESPNDRFISFKDLNHPPIFPKVFPNLNPINIDKNPFIKSIILSAPKKSKI